MVLWIIQKYSLFFTINVVYRKSHLKPIHSLRHYYWVFSLNIISKFKLNCWFQSLVLICQWECTLVQSPPSLRSRCLGLWVRPLSSLLLFTRFSTDIPIWLQVGGTLMQEEPRSTSCVRTTMTTTATTENCHKTLTKHLWNNSIFWW